MEFRGRWCGKGTVRGKGTKWTFLTTYLMSLHFYHTQMGCQFIYQVWSWSFRDKKGFFQGQETVHWKSYLSHTGLSDSKTGVCHPGCVAQMVRVLFHAPKCCQFDSQSRHTHRMQVQSLVGAHSGGSWSVCLSHVDVSFSLPLSLKINGNMSLRED